MDIHNQVGILEQPLTTLGDQLPDWSRKNLENVTQQVLQQSNFKQRAQWCIQRHPLRSMLGMGLMGLFGAMAVMTLVEKMTDGK